MRSIFRVLLGLIAALLVAGLVQASFIITPADLAGHNGGAFADRLQGLGVLALLAFTQAAAYAGLPALIALGLAERWQIRWGLFYVVLGLALAAAGFFVQAIPEGAVTTGTYALSAYTATGLAAGLVYWLMAGRRAGGRRA